jgi:hypothetical protein
MDRVGETALHKLLKQKTSSAEQIAMVKVSKTPRKGPTWLEGKRRGKEISSGTPRTKTLLEGMLMVKGSQRKKVDEEKKKKGTTRPLSASDFRQAAKDHISLDAILAIVWGCFQASHLFVT